MKSLPPEVQDAFWNLDPGNLEPERDRALIISTVLPRGGTVAVRWLFGTYGPTVVREFVIRDAEGMRNLPDSDRELWLRILAPDYRSNDDRRANRWRTSRHI
ncbi:MAG TPA: hypothetical protein VNI34_05485 [Candidatus Nitrosotalea sp.]|nr:hypothetical protein [Candidatus Nitrosotalea sp.]